MNILSDANCTCRQPPDHASSELDRRVQLAQPQTPTSLPAPGSHSNLHWAKKVQTLSCKLKSMLSIFLWPTTLSWTHFELNIHHVHVLLWCRMLTIGPAISLKLKVCKQGSKPPPSPFSLRRASAAAAGWCVPLMISKSISLHTLRSI